jgi:hypothetical protein
MRNQLTLNQVALLVLIYDDLEEALVFCEEQVAVSESHTSCWLRGQHIESFTSTIDCERPAPIFSSTLKVTHLVNFGFTLRILRQFHFVIDNIHHVSLFIDGLLCYM